MRRKWQPTPVFLPGESHGQRSLAGYSPGGGKDLATKQQPSMNSQVTGPRGPQSWPFSALPNPYKGDNNDIHTIIWGASPGSPGLHVLKFICAQITTHMDSSSSSSLQTVNIPSPGRKPAHQAPHRGSPVSAGAPGGRGGDGLRGFHAPPVSLPVINPLTLELGAGTEVSKPESVQCPSHRRSRKEFVYTRWALYYQKYIYIYSG